MIRRTHAPRTARRRAFTIVELMVVTVVVLILMSILVAASTIATDTVRAAKAQGDHVSQERTILTLLRRDLQYPHFLEEDGKPNLGRRLSDQRTDKLSWYDETPTGMTRTWRSTGYKPPRSGYFFASSRPAPATAPTWNSGDTTTWNFSEGSDPEGFQSSRSANHVLQFTVVVPGGAPEDRLVADVPFQNSPSSSSYPITGTCGEVAYFLVPNLTTPGGVAKYKLVRRWRLAARSDDDAPAYSSLLNGIPGLNPNDPAEVMAATYTMSTFKMLHMNELTLGANRLIRAQIPQSGGYRIGEDILHSNVTSFEVKFTGSLAPGVTVSWLAPNANDAASNTWPRPFVPGPALPMQLPAQPNTDYPYDNLPYDGNYDTFNSTQGDWNDAKYLAGSQSPDASAASPMKRIRITGAMIRLRCWSPATKSTRQTTIQVDL